MQYILTQKEYDKLLNGIENEREKLKTIIETLCTDVTNNKPILYDPLRKSTTIANRYKEIFNVKFIVINESATTIKTRLISRGGSIADDFDKYYNKFVKYASKANFSGSSDEVLAYLRSIIV